MSIIRAAAVVATVVVLAACGGSDGADCTPVAANPTPRPPAITSPTTGFDVLITDADRAVTVRSGQRIELVLHARPGMSTWSGVNVDDYTILKAVPTGITAPAGVTVAGYEAARTGTATIRATATPLCSPGQACPAFAMLFEVVVTVT